MNKHSFRLGIGSIFLIVFLHGYALAAPTSLPYDAWSLDFFAPDYMDVWIETADVVDINRRLFRGAGSGIPAMGYPRALSKGVPKEFRGKPAGWRDHVGGKGRYVMGADLPRLVYVRWQSIAEPQTYEAYIEVPESARKTMLKRENVFCRADDKWIFDYRNLLVIGLAPGGIAKVWLAGPCLKSTEVTRVQGTINPEGPYRGMSNGEYYDFEEESKAYVEKFGIPFGSW
ncbi:DUF2931 family protein [Pseudomonas sp. MYb118]|uniref:DUF2931 family protein n=1 Tax=Pseudomonas sp. MYb118 TaxID=1848720 RepID=UPI0034CDD4A8